MSNPHHIKVSLVQHACQADRAYNLSNIVEGIKSAAQQGAQLVLLQELHNSLYFCQTESNSHFELAEPIPGPSTSELSLLAREYDLVIVASLFERRASGLYHNTAVVLDSDGRLAGIYRKMHIPDDPGYYEKFYFTPGDLGFTPIKTSIGNLGILICWDQWFPEAARLMALAGADILLYPTAIGWDQQDSEEEKQRQLQAWITIQRAHAIANGLPLLACNRIGFETAPNDAQTGIDFWGNSFICGPQGEILAQAAQNQSAVLVTELDMHATEQVRRSWPYLRDRRIDAYQGLNQRYLDNPIQDE